MAGDRQKGKYIGKCERKRTRREREGEKKLQSSARTVTDKIGWQRQIRIKII